MSLETWELLSYVVTVIGLPLAIAVFFFEQRKERENEDEEVYQLLSDNYQDFLKVALANPDLKLFSAEATPSLTEEQNERLIIIFEMLTSLFERAYLLLYDKNMSPNQARRWHSWEDYILEWCRRSDFRSRMPQLLSGEDPGFVQYVERLAGPGRSG
ncbi:MAG TPA: hypothetical protein VFB61_10625 [Gemmatimonadales bacterium]|nr:hypothetical protein [Gemmatimonadales bacterium]